MLWGPQATDAPAGHVRRYRKRPVVVEAMQLTADNFSDVLRWIRQNGGATAGLNFNANGPIEGRYIDIGTLEGTMRLCVGNFLVRGTVGEFWPVRADIFEQSYEAVVDQAAEELSDA